MKKIITSILSASIIFAVIAPVSAQSVTCQRIGNQIFCSNGVTCQIIGSQTFCNK